MRDEWVHGAIHLNGRIDFFFFLLMCILHLHTYVWFRWAGSGSFIAWLGGWNNVGMYIRMLGIFFFFAWIGLLFFSTFLGIHIFFHSIIMILRNLIHPQTIPVAHATLTPINGKNSYFDRIPLSFPV
jgi:hypothetical protein